MFSKKLRVRMIRAAVVLLTLQCAGGHRDEDKHDIPLVLDELVGPAVADGRSLGERRAPRSSRSGTALAASVGARPTELLQVAQAAGEEERLVGKKHRGYAGNQIHRAARHRQYHRSVPGLSTVDDAGAAMEQKATSSSRSTTAAASLVELQSSPSGETLSAAPGDRRPRSAGRGQTPVANPTWDEAAQQQAQLQAQLQAQQQAEEPADPLAPQAAQPQVVSAEPAPRRSRARPVAAAQQVQPPLSVAPVQEGNIGGGPALPDAASMEAAMEAQPPPAAQMQAAARSMPRSSGAGQVPVVTAPVLVEAPAAPGASSPPASLVETRDLEVAAHVNVDICPGEAAVENGMIASCGHADSPKWGIAGGAYESNKVVYYLKYEDTDFTMCDGLFVRCDAKRSADASCHCPHFDAKSKTCQEKTENPEISKEDLLKSKMMKQILKEEHQRAAKEKADAKLETEEDETRKRKDAQEKKIERLEREMRGVKRADKKLVEAMQVIATHLEEHHGRTADKAKVVENEGRGRGNKDEEARNERKRADELAEKKNSPEGEHEDRMSSEAESEPADMDSEREEDQTNQEHAVAAKLAPTKSSDVKIGGKDEFKEAKKKVAADLAAKKGSEQTVAAKPAPTDRSEEGEGEGEDNVSSESPSDPSDESIGGEDEFKEAEKKVAADLAASKGSGKTVVAKPAPTEAPSKPADVNIGGEGNLRKAEQKVAANLAATKSSKDGEQREKVTSGEPSESVDVDNSREEESLDREGNDKTTIEEQEREHQHEPRKAGQETKQEAATRAQNVNEQEQAKNAEEKPKGAEPTEKEDLSSEFADDSVSESKSGHSP
eukprot:TRINITY_DN19_c0_g1_i1.p1 TRINITY_DN19_c0_g1~~TRINITY_DN19_c0_g1_i1.p1  ORF type:complete len:842 (+),score=175.08 TRINITY_DN19_c0_g1_i1:28-2526(+)